MNNLFNVLIALAAGTISTFFAIGSFQVIKNLKSKEHSLRDVHAKNTVSTAKKGSELMVH